MAPLQMPKPLFRCPAIIWRANSSFCWGNWMDKRQRTKESPNCSLRPSSPQACSSSMRFAWPSWSHTARGRHAFCKTARHIVKATNCRPDTYTCILDMYVWCVLFVWLEAQLILPAMSNQRRLSTICSSSAGSFHSDKLFSGRGTGEALETAEAQVKRLHEQSTDVTTCTPAHTHAHAAPVPRPHGC